MVRIAPVRMTFNPKTLWFDAGDLNLAAGQDVVVVTARGNEFGTLTDPVFEMEEEDANKLKSPLKPVKRIATDEDRARQEELTSLSRAALAVFKRLAAETTPDMNPVSVEYLFDGEKAVFYFESEERIDFRDLVRKLAAELHVRIDMKQIGVRDSARMIGGLGHCGQELCCCRLGGEFNPVSIRMAKEQDLSLNPQKISGVCGRLMCCLRYEFEAYKDFHSRAPKKNARIMTPDGEGKVVELDVPREIVSIKVGDEKPVKVPLADMEAPEEGMRPNVVGDEAWERANEPSTLGNIDLVNLFTNELTGEDKLAEPGTIRHVHENEPKKPSRSRSRRRSGTGGESSDGVGKGKGQGEGSREQVDSTRKPRRRRSTTVNSDSAVKQEAQNAAKKKRQHTEEGAKRQPPRRRRNRTESKAQPQHGASADRQQKTSQVGRNSSALRANRPVEHGEGTGRRRRRSHRTDSGSGAGKE